MLVHIEPVRRDGSLRLQETHGACAHLIVQVVLDPVLFVEAGPRFGCFGPQVGDVIASSHLERHQVIDFVLARCALGDCVLAIHLAADLGGNVPNR
jgi:hypothetical protein